VVESRRYDSANYSDIYTSNTAISALVIGLSSALSFVPLAHLNTVTNSLAKKLSHLVYIRYLIEPEIPRSEICNGFGGNNIVGVGRVANEGCGVLLISSVTLECSTLKFKTSLAGRSNFASALHYAQCIAALAFLGCGHT
jgi:hypothetical protein